MSLNLALRLSWMNLNQEWTMKRICVAGLLVGILSTAGSAWAETPVERGEYLTGLLSCGYCHTPGGMVGSPDYGQLLAGSDIGLAYSPFQEPDRPAVVFPGNLTPDKATGLGRWTDEQIAMLIQTGVDRQGQQHVPVMPWSGYAMLKQEDVDAIVAYLRTLKSVRHETPENVNEGNVSEHSWIRFGVYRFDPDGQHSERSILDVR
jgi:mono/diheme cytochrome c family protein